MAEAIILPQFVPDLSKYALTEHTHSGYASKKHTHSQYLTSHQSLASYATKTWVTNNFAPKGSGGSSSGNSGSGTQSIEITFTKTQLLSAGNNQSLGSYTLNWTAGSCTVSGTGNSQIPISNWGNVRIGTNYSNMSPTGSVTPTATESECGDIQWGLEGLGNAFAYIYMSYNGSVLSIKILKNSGGMPGPEYIPGSNFIVRLLARFS